MNPSERIETAPAPKALPAPTPTPPSPTPDPAPAPPVPVESATPAVPSCLGTIDKLSLEEAAEYQACEATISKGWDAYVETGLALAQIQDRQLYRAEFNGFDEYCRKRWGIQRCKAHNAIAAARIAIALATLPDVAKPDHEAQLRPLFGLSPDAAQLAWQCAIANNSGRRITESMVRRAVKELALINKPPPPKARVNKAEQRKLVNHAIGELLVLARQKVAYDILISKLEKLHGHIQGLFAKRALKD